MQPAQLWRPAGQRETKELVFLLVDSLSYLHYAQSSLPNFILHLSDEKVPETTENKLS